MLTSYFKIAIRGMRRQKGYAFINIVGLAIGVAACLLIALYVRDELTFDHFHANADRIFRLHREPVPESPIDAEVVLPTPAGPALKAALPAVEHFVRFNEADALIRLENDTFADEQLLYADTSFFEVFSFPLSQGSPGTALQEPFSAVLSADAARRYFGSANPLGESISVWAGDGYHTFTVTGVTNPIPSNSSITFDVLVPYHVRFSIFEGARREADDWGASNAITYLLLRTPEDAAAVQAALPAFTATYQGWLFEALRSNGFWTKPGSPFRYRIQPIRDIHFNTDVPAGLSPPSSRSYSYILGAIGLGILLLACINFTTLAVARSSSRVTEVSVRKVVGARRTELMRQFWTESFVMTALAVAAGVCLAWAGLSTFEDLAQKQFSVGWSDVSSLLLVLLGITGLVALVGGSYPAAHLSRFQPVEVFRRGTTFGRANTFTRALIIGQFALSAGLLVGTMVMSRQLSYLQTRDLGFDEEHVVSVPIYRLDDERSAAHYRQVLENQSAIAGVTASNVSFTRFSNRMGFRHDGRLYEPHSFRIDHQYIATMGMDLVAGRNFDPRRSSDSTGAVIVNEAFLRELGWENAVGKNLPGLEWGALRAPEVIGVVGDFNFSSMRERVQPVVLTMNPDQRVNYLMVRLQSRDVYEAASTMESAWSNIAGDVPFQFSFLDEDLDAQYHSDARWRRIVGYGSSFAILIACMGLFGLALLNVIARSKEIGIRKVLGASATRLAVLLSRELIIMVMIGTAIAAPIAYVAASRWLETFAYRIGTGTVLEALMIAACIIAATALATTAVHTVRTALGNPVERLRHE